MALEKGVKGGINVLMKVVNGAKKLLSFLKTGLGFIVLKLTLILLLVIFIYILAMSLWGGIMDLLGLPSPSADEYKKSSEFLQNLSTSGYDAMLNAEQLIRYYSFEYCVLMDAAEYIETVGVTPIKVNDSGGLDFDRMTRHQWAELAAAAFQADGAKSEVSAIEAALSPSNDGSGGAGGAGGSGGSGDSGDPDAPKPPPVGEFYYRIVKNTYTDQSSLLPYFRIQRQDHNLRYFLEIKNNGAGGGGDDLGLDFGDGLMVASVGSTYNMGSVTSGGQTGFYVMGQGDRFNVGGMNAGGASFSAGAAFIENHVFAVRINMELNASNTAAFASNDARAKKMQKGQDFTGAYFEGNRTGEEGGKDTTGQIDLNKEYTESDLYYSDEAKQYTYEVPLRSLLDRFLPNASLLSSWRYLSEDSEYSEGQSSEAEDLVRDIMTIYNCASLSGEEIESTVLLLKDVLMQTNVTEHSSAKELVDSVSFAGQDLVEKYFDSKDTNTKYNSYVPTYDTRYSGYESKFKDEKGNNVKKNTEETFSGGSLKKDIIDDVKLAMSTLADINQIGFNSSVMTEVENVINSSEIPDSVNGDIEALDNDIIVYAKSADGKDYYKCVGGNTASSKLLSHYNLSNQDGLSIITGTSPVEHTVVMLNGVEQSHVNTEESCRVPLLKINFNVKNGLKSTVVIIHSKDKYYAFQIKSKEQEKYGDYTNNYAFAHLESGDLQSTTFKHWEVALDGESSDESWLVTDAFEGLTYGLGNLDSDNITYYVNIYLYGEGGSITRYRVNLFDYLGISSETIKASLNIDDAEVFRDLIGQEINPEAIFSAGNLAIVRDSDQGGSFSTDGSTGDRHEYYSDEILARPENANLSDGGSPMTDALIAGRQGECSTTDEAGETLVTEWAYLNLKKQGIKVEDNIDISISNAKAGIKEKIKDGLQGQATAARVNAILNMIKSNKNINVPDKALLTTTIVANHRVHDTDSHEELGWGWDTAGIEVKDFDLIAQFAVVMPIRCCIMPISQKVIDKKMPAYFVKDADYWAAIKEFNNSISVQGQFKDYENEYYLISNNHYASGIKKINSDYKLVKWRCNLFAPIFGGERMDNSGREDDIKLILSEWEQVGDSGVGSADHAIRDLNCLIQYSKGVRDETGNSWARSGDVVFEPIKDSKGEAYVNEDSYSFLYIPDEIIRYDPLKSETAFWLDRIISSEEDPIYDKINPNNSSERTEANLRSRLPIFTWQVVDYDLYDETEVEGSGGIHAAYALWPYGGQFSRTLYAIAANASSKEVEKIVGWGGTSTVHKAADLYGREEATRVYQSIFGESNKRINSPIRNIINEFYGYGYYNLGGGDGASVKAKFVSSGGVGDAVLYAKGSNVPTSNSYDKITIDNSGEMIRDFTSQDVDTSSVTTGTQGLYFKSTPVTLRLGGTEYTFSGTASAVYAYELYRQTLINKNGETAEKIIKDKLEKEMSWTEICAIAPGIVTSVTGDSTSGFRVELLHVKGSNGVKEVTSSYCHMKRYPVVQEGQYVGAGTVLGYEGTTGKSGGFHCHITLKIGDTPAKPVYYFYPFFTPFWYEEMSEEALESAGGRDNVFLDSEYFSTARTVYPYGQIVGSDVSSLLNAHSNDKVGINDIAQITADANGGTIKTPEVDNYGGNSYVKIKNYTPMYAMTPDSNNLVKKADAWDKPDMLVSSVVSLDGNKPDYTGKELHTNPNFTDEKFMKKVMRRMGRIHGGRAGIMQYWSNISGQLDKIDIWNELLLEIGVPEAVLGIMGNLYQESRYRSNLLNEQFAAKHNITSEEYTKQVDDGTIDPALKGNGAYGLAQWLGGRQLELIDLSKDFGVSVSDGGLQLNFLIYEVNYMPFSGTQGHFLNKTYGGKNLYLMILIDILQDTKILEDVGKEIWANNGSRIENYYKAHLPNRPYPISGNPTPSQYQIMGATGIFLYGFEKPNDPDELELVRRCCFALSESTELDL